MKHITPITMVRADELALWNFCTAVWRAFIQFLYEKKNELA